jgi:hypothetical protein
MMAAGRPQSKTFDFKSATAEIAADQLARFAVRAAVLTYADDLTRAQRQLSERTDLSVRTVNAKLSIGERNTLDEKYVSFVRDVQQYLRDEYGIETYLTTFFNEIRRFGRGFVPEEAAELDREWFIPLTNTGKAHSKEMAMLRGWSAVAWIEHQRSRAQLHDQLSQPIEGDYARTRPRTYQARIDECVEDLLSVASMPAGQGHLAAASLLGKLGWPVLERIGDHVRESPVGWRTVRAATQLLLYARGTERMQREPIERAVFSLLKDIHRNNYRNSYRARSFWEECADALPRPTEETYKGDYDEIIDILIERAVTHEDNVKDASSWPYTSDSSRVTPSACPVRERQTAAVVAVERIIDWVRKNRHTKWDVKQRLIEPLRKSANILHKGDGYAYTELDYTAAFLEYIMSSEDNPEVSVMYPGPHGQLGAFWGERPEVAFVTDQLQSPLTLEIADTVDASLCEPWLILVGSAILAVSGILRRRILESLVAGGLGGPSAEVFLQVATTAQEVHVRGQQVLRFVVENSVFNASYMNTPTVIPRLLPFCVPDPDDAGSETFSTLTRGIRMTALHGIGDLAHWIQKDKQYSELRRLVVGGILSRFWSEDVRTQFTRPELRAALHTLAMIRLVVEEEDATGRNADLQREVYRALHALIRCERVGEFVFDEEFMSDRQPSVLNRGGEPGEIDRRTRELAVWCLLRMHARQEVLESVSEDCVPSRLVSPRQDVHNAMQHIDSLKS